MISVPVQNAGNEWYQYSHHLIMRFCTLWNGTRRMILYRILFNVIHAVSTTARHEEAVSKGFE